MVQDALISNPFLFDTGHKKLRALFYETTLADKSHVLYTLKNRDHSGYPSLYRLYMEMDDPTEYNFAVAYLDGWDHWLTLCECAWFKPYVQAWRKELEVRTKARALKAVRDLADNPDAKEHYQASKFLIQSGWVEKTAGRKGAGRPSKEDVKKEATRLAEEQRELADEMSRVGLN
jgi:hypothetical protein